MFFPIRTDRQLKSTPWVNYALIAVNVVVYAFTWRSVEQSQLFSGGGYSMAEIFQNAPGVGLWLWPDTPNTRLYQFITYQFVHSGPEPIPLPFIQMQLPLHLAFNMLFLYVFGNAVEDRLGKLGYLAFYLAGGVLAGLAHISDPTAAPVLGASGSVAAVTGIYLALFPMSNVTIAYWLVVFMGSFVVSSMVLILFRVVLDLIFQFSGYDNTAYIAHLAGYLYGFLIGMGLLMIRLLPRESYDMLALIEQKRRRAQFKRLNQQGFKPWEHAGGAGTLPPKPGQAVVASPEDEALMARRAEVSSALAQQDVRRASDLYAKLLRDYPGQVFPMQAQLDLINQLMQAERYDVSAEAYELFLAHHQDSGFRPQAQLTLALIYLNYLKEPGRARTLLKQAQPSLTGSDRALATSKLESLG